MKKMAEYCPMCGATCDIEGDTTRHYVPRELKIRAHLGHLIGEHENLRRRHEELKHRMHHAEKVITAASRVFYREGAAYVDWAAANEMREALKDFPKAEKQNPD